MTDSTGTKTWPTPIAGAGLFLLAAGTAAIVIDFSETHAGQHADSLIPVLSSLLHWEPYFWGADRNGQLLPLLAAPCRHPFHNLLIQTGLSIFAGIVALGVFARLIAPFGWPLAAAGAWALIEFGLSEYGRFNMLNPCQPYVTSMLFAGGGLWMVSEKDISRLRWSAALLLFVIVGWINVGLGMNLGPWLLFRWVLAGSTSGQSIDRLICLRGLALLVFGTAVGMGLKQLSPYSSTPLSFLPSNKWLAGWQGVGQDLTHHFGANLECSVVLLVVSLVWLIVPGKSAGTVRLAKEGLAALAALIASFLFIGTTEWVASNGYSSRFLFPSLMVLNVAAAGAAIGPLLEKIPSTYRSCLNVAAIVLIAALPVTVYGWPSVQKARSALDARKPVVFDEVMDWRCTHVCGQYWDVWPTVFFVNLELFERGEGRVVWGIAPRAECTRPEWLSMPDTKVRLGCLRKPGRPELPPEVIGLLHHEFSRLRLVQSSDHLDLYAIPVGVAGER